MSILATRNAICFSIIDEYFKSVAPILNIANTVQSAINGVINDLTTLVFTPSVLLNSAILDFTDALSGMIPGSADDDISEILSIIQNCSFLSNGNTNLANPYSLAKKAEDSILGELYGLIDDYATTPEFAVAKELHLVEDMLNQKNSIANTMRKLDGILSCSSAVCGVDFASITQDALDQMNMLYGKLNIISDPASALFGTIDFDSIYTSAGISLEGIANMNTTFEAVASAKETVVSSVSTLRTALKVRNLVSMVA